MKKIYYTRLNIIDIGTNYDVQIGDEHFRHIFVMPIIFQERKDPIHFELYNSVKKQLGNDQFILVPSAFEVEMQAYLDDMRNHREKYPMGADEACHGFGMDEDD